MSRSRSRGGHRLLNVLALVAILGSLTVVLCFYVVATGASSDQQPEPLAFDGGESVRVICLGDRRWTQLTDGSNVIRYKGEATLVIEKVDLVDGDGLRVVEALVLPVGTTAIGSSAQWPPPNAKSDLAQAIPAVGATMSRDGATRLNLVAHLARTEGNKPVRAGALRIFYTVGDKKHASVAPVRTAVESEGSCR